MHNVSLSPEQFGTVAALGAALIALLSAVFTVWNTGRTIRATVVSTNRQKWIDSVRDDLALFLRLSSINHMHHWSETPPADLIEEMQAARKEMHLLSLRILLKLNPAEKEHVQFIGMIEELRTTSRPQRDELPDRLARAGQDIFKAEWERIKRGR
jgi:hypothetical protein